MSSKKKSAEPSAAQGYGSLAAPGGAKSGRYHHGDLRAALVEAAIQLIDERGVRDFSLAEASRRIGVAVSAPYAHFADRDDLLAAVMVHAYKLFYAELAPKISRARTPAERLAAISRAYVRFAGDHRPLFETLFDAGVDKSRHPEIAVAERPIEDAFLESVRDVTGSSTAASEELAVAIEATAHGHATLLLDGRFGRGVRAVDLAAKRAARATLALIESRNSLTS